MFVLNRQRTPARRSCARPVRGFSFIEVLVTMVLISVALIGLAGVGGRASLSEMESYQRTQASLLVQDMVDRMNANRLSGAGATATGNPTNPVVLDTCYSGQVLGTGYTGTPACAAGSATQNAQAVADLVAWNAELLGAAETTSTGRQVGAMIGAVGCIDTLDAANHIYMVSVHWQGLVATAAPTAVGACGGNPPSFGAANLHRVVTMTLQVGALL
ncbi:MAG: type IV pilus modification protein PilV [Burkholderiales bacterium]|nr:type IV pilus modification protein PilV [Burkholderiales bacterium]MDE2394352.1 type IV pilus modification protein PilV [Burkholderiales bacterium]MDE2452887.1 type IV pilus modification protein PilV [Burkholderiales bacterium]